MSLRRFFPILCLPVLLGSCLGLSVSQATPSLYLIDHPMSLLPEVPDEVDPLPYRVRIRDVEFPRVLDRNRIVYRHSPNRLNYYRYHQWAVPPRTMVSDVLARHVAAAGVFEEVRRQFTEKQPDLEIRGALHALERLEGGEFGAAHLAMNLRLMRRTDAKELAYHEFDREARLHTASMTFFAQTISRLLAEETAIFLQRIWERFGVDCELPGVAPPVPGAERDDSGYRIIPLPRSRRIEEQEDTP